MSVGINITKRITVKDEGSSLTTNVNSIDFTGDGVTASVVGDDVTVNIPGGAGNVTYYLNQTVTQAPYKEFSSIPTSASEQTISATINAGVTQTIQSFQSPSGSPGTTNIPAGLWSFYLHFTGTASHNWLIFVEVYKRDLGGTETLLLTTDSIAVTGLSSTPTMILTDGVFPASSVLTTDRIVIKVRATHVGSGSPQTINLITEGSTNYSVSTTTLNQIVPTGAVTSVAGTAPIVSSGGTTPAISIPQATALVDGYLDSADFSTFAGKQDPINLTTTGSSGAATFIANTLNIPNYTPSLTAGTGIGISGTYPNLTISNTDPTTGVTLASAGGTSLVNDGTGPSLATKGLSAGSGILIGATATTVSITNSAPDQVVALTAGTGIGVSGTYPNFTISNTGTVSSGKIGIADSTGTYTFYTSLALACAAASFGQTIVLFTDVTETTATTAILPDGVDLNLNGYSYTLDVAGITNAIETAVGANINNIYNGTIIRRNVGGSSFTVGVSLRNRSANLNLYGVYILNEDDCTALSIDESCSIKGSWRARSEGPSASGVSVQSGHSPSIYGGDITSINYGIYVDTSSTINVFDSNIQSSNTAIFCFSDVGLFNCTVVAFANTTIEIDTGVATIERCLIIGQSGSALGISSGYLSLTNSYFSCNGASAITIGTITANSTIIGCRIATLSGTDNFRIENLQAVRVEIVNNYFYISGSGTRRNLTFAFTSDAGNADIQIKNNSFEVASSGIAGSSCNILFQNYTSGFYRISGNEFKCGSPSASARNIKTGGIPITLAYINNVLKVTNGQNPIDTNITQGNPYTPDIYGNIETTY